MQRQASVTAQKAGRHEFKMLLQLGVVFGVLRENGRYCLFQALAREWANDTALVYEVVATEPPE